MSGEVRAPDPSSEEKIFNISFSDIMEFSTGAPSKPPIGFLPQPSIKFVGSRFPKSNTCSNILYLPSAVGTKEDFFYSMSFGILNTCGFGQL